jgi:hypothetical protein
MESIYTAHHIFIRSSQLHPENIFQSQMLLIKSPGEAKAWYDGTFKNLVRSIL